MRVLNGISEGLLLTGLLGLVIPWAWGRSPLPLLSLWLFGAYCALWGWAVVFSYPPLVRFFHRTPRLPTRFSPDLVPRLLAWHPHDPAWIEPRSTVVDACRILSQRMSLAIRSLLFVIVGLLLVATERPWTLRSWTHWLPIVQGIVGALLGIADSGLIKHRLSQIQRML